MHGAPICARDGAQGCLSAASAGRASGSCCCIAAIGVDMSSIRYFLGRVHDVIASGRMNSRLERQRIRGKRRREVFHNLSSNEPHVTKLAGSESMHSSTFRRFTTSWNDGFRGYGMRAQKHKGTKAQRHKGTIG
ncbi:uncharacterized protein LOC112495346 [Cephus cinctus]|uniref:Uncharacterized protein LOC112495346 n=1 Tax=Cephus cinctus TaxID=211228 RepID=A0AAJ7RVP0_CEPCN|nr:uncharacterized protein LOC112495346 [Cephus cinctus]